MRISDWSSDVCSSDLKASTGITEADKGSIIFDGREITHTPPHEIAGLDVRLMLGGAGTFPSLTVDENLRSAAWLHRKDRKAMTTPVPPAPAPFPPPAHRPAAPASHHPPRPPKQPPLALAPEPHP